jgi:hypothetical protein
MSEQCLDLFDIALLLNYEKSTSEPRFRNAKLVDYAFPGQETNIKVEAKAWKQNDRTILIFDKLPSGTGTDDRDLPSNMLLDEHKKSNAKLRSLTSKQIETLFYQARGHDGCFIAVALIQHFFDLYPPDTGLRIRHIGKGRDPGISYVTQINRRHIREDIFLGPKCSTVSLVSNSQKTVQQYVSGATQSMPHAVFAFAPLDAQNPVSFLDLSSMQFGDIGRGPGEKGKGLFALDTWDEFVTRLPNLADGNDGNVTKTSARVGSTPLYDTWLKKVARRAKQRWDKQDEEKWCGHCGGPVPEVSKCSKCKKAWFCSREHMEMAWPFHKGYCRQS